MVEEQQINDILNKLSYYGSFIKSEELGNFSSDKQYLDSENKNTAHKVIIDEIDEIYKRGLDSKLNNLDSVA